MSGKPATPPASRVAVPGAPRLLVYVADQRQLEAGGSAVPRGPPPPDVSASTNDIQYQLDNSHTNFSALENATFEQNERRCMGVPDAVYYKPISDNDDKTFSAYGVSDNSAPRADYYTVSQSLVKSQNLKVEDNKINNISNTTSVTFQSRVVADSADIQLYQMRCPAGQGTVVTQFQAFNATQKTFDNVNISSDNLISERNKDYGCMNYQFLEHSVSQQSLVNETSVLSDQGSVRGVDSESSASLPPQHIAVPSGWRRILSATSVLYIRYSYL